MASSAHGSSSSMAAESGVLDARMMTATFYTFFFFAFKFKPTNYTLYIYCYVYSITG